MAKEHSKSQAHACKEKDNQNKKDTKNHTAQTVSLTPLLQRRSHNEHGDHNDEWWLSEEIAGGDYPTHNHYIGTLRCDTLLNVCAGIQTLAALLSVSNDKTEGPASDPHHGAYWLSLNLRQALAFEIYHRDKLMATPAEPEA